MALGSCVNNIVSLKPPPHAWLFPAFSNKQRPLTLTLKTSPSSSKRGTFFCAQRPCFQQLVQKGSMINCPASFFCAQETSYLASQSYSSQEDQEGPGVGGHFIGQWGSQSTDLLKVMKQHGAWWDQANLTF